MARTRSQVQADLDTWYAARTAIATGQAYAIGGRTLTRASLKDVNDTIKMLERELSRAISDEAGVSQIARPLFISGLGYQPRIRP